MAEYAPQKLKSKSGVEVVIRSAVKQEAVASPPFLFEDDTSTSKARVGLRPGDGGGLSRHDVFLKHAAPMNRECERDLSA